MQRFSHDGEPVGTETMVNAETTDNSDEAFVGMSHDGRFMVLWQDTALPRANEIDGVLYDANGNVLANYQPAGQNALGSISGTGETDTGQYLTTCRGLLAADAVRFARPDGGLRRGRQLYH